MGESGLIEAIQEGDPLVEITVEFVNGIEYGKTTELLNRLAGNFHLPLKPWYRRPGLRVGSATNEPLGRVFGGRLKQVPLAGHSGFYCWGAVSPVQWYSVQGVIKTVGMIQPGANDDAPWYE